MKIMWFIDWYYCQIFSKPLELFPCTDSNLHSSWIKVLHFKDLRACTSTSDCSNCVEVGKVVWALKLVTAPCACSAATLFKVKTPYCIANKFKYLDKQKGGQKQKMILKKEKKIGVNLHLNLLSNKKAGLKYLYLTLFFIRKFVTLNRCFF